MAPPQSLRQQRVARARDREVAPVWDDRFARLIYRHLPMGEDPFVLDVDCGAGRSSYGLLDRLGPGTRVLGVESDETLRGMANARMEAAWKDRVYFQPGDLTSLGEMADDTYDLLVANLVLGAEQEVAPVLEEFMRLVRPGGRILATLPMSGTWTEAEDLFHLVLIDDGRSDAAKRLRRLARLRKTGPEIADIAAGLGIAEDDVVIEQERFSLLFNGGRDFLFSPMVEHGPLRAWKAIVADHPKPQELFWRLKEAIDVYYAEAVFSVTIVAGVLVLSVPDPAGARVPSPVARTYWARYPRLDALFARSEHGMDSVDEEDVELDIELDEDDGSTRVAPPAPSASSSLLSAEDAAIFALLETPVADSESDAELDSLLDQVLEFANTPDTRAADADAFEPEALAEITAPTDIKTKPGDTLNRIRALLPPPPTGTRASGAAKRAPPPAPQPRRPGPPPPPPPGPKKKP